MPPPDEVLHRDTILDAIQAETWFRMGNMSGSAHAVSADLRRVMQRYVGDQPTDVPAAQLLVNIDRLLDALHEIAARVDAVYRANLDAEKTDAALRKLGTDNAPIG